MNEIIKLENDEITITIKKFGAELVSAVNKKNNVEYIWHGKTGGFQKSAPNLFPFIGNILKGEINYPVHDGKRLILPMTKHGFARDLDFDILETTDTTVRFELKPNDYTKERYPYNFSFVVEYILEGNVLSHNYIVKNNDTIPMYYHVGGHTAFSCEYLGDKKYENYYLEFEDKEYDTYKMDKINKTYLSRNKIKTSVEGKYILSKDKFKDDALIFDNVVGNVINIKNFNSSHGVEFKFENLPILTIWTSADESEFICLEPWAGVTDFTDGSNVVENKKNIEILNSNETKTYKQVIKFL